MKRIPRRPEPEAPKTLVFAPLAWLKLQFFTHQGDTEIGGFGITAEDDPLHVTEFVTVRQAATAVSVHFEDQAVADFFERCVDRGLKPSSFARIWIHTHPCASPDPSGIDEDTFTRIFGRCDWGIMFILGRTGLTYARISFSAGPGGSTLMPTSVDWESWPEWLAEHPDRLGPAVAEWREEFTANIQPVPLIPAVGPTKPSEGPSLMDPWWDFLPWSPELDEMHFGLPQELYEHQLIP